MKIMNIDESYGVHKNVVFNGAFNLWKYWKSSFSREFNLVVNIIIYVFGKKSTA